MLKKFCLLYFLCSFTNTLYACTGLQHMTQAGDFVNGRTVEFGPKIPLTGIFVPRGYKFIGSLPDNKQGLVYVSKYAVIGANVYARPAVIDGMNEKGLSAAAFYFPGYAEYNHIDSANAKLAVAPTEFVNWLLTQFADIQEVKDGLARVLIAPTSQPEWHGVPPFHYIVYDKSGKSLVIEPTKGKLVVFDNPIGVITNSPTFDWHLTNLSNFIPLSPTNVPEKTIHGFKLQQFGQGNGLHGLPGDFTPPSRFVRAAFYSVNILPAENSTHAVFEVFHLLNQFDIPYGAVRSVDKEIDFTQATTVKDPSSLKYYFKTYSDQNIKAISMSSFDVNSKKLRLLDIENSKQSVMDISTSNQWHSVK